MDVSHEAWLCRTQWGHWWDWCGLTCYLQKWRKLSTLHNAAIIKPPVTLLTASCKVPAISKQSLLILSNRGFKSIAYFLFSDVLLWFPKAEVIKSLAKGRSCSSISSSVKRIKSHKSCTRSWSLQSSSPGYRPKKQKIISSGCGCLIPRINCSGFRHYLLALLQIFFSKFI